VKPKTIVSVLDSLSPAKDVALTRALSLADWYESANEAIALAASGWGADLVVLGLPRRSRMEAFVVGSTVLRAGLFERERGPIADAWFSKGANSDAGRHAARRGGSAGTPRHRLEGQLRVS